MQTFVEQSELYREIKDFRIEEFVMTNSGTMKEVFGITGQIESDLAKVISGSVDSLQDDIDILLFAYMWKITKVYHVMLKHVKINIFKNKYHTEILKEKMCNDILADMFNKTDDMEKIACFGQLWLMKFAHENGHPWNNLICANSANNGHIDCLKYAHENGCPWFDSTCTFAAHNGHLDCLKYAHENGCVWNAMTCSWAAKNGHLDCLKYAHENGCPWDKMTTQNAAKNGHLDCLKYAHENGCYWDDDTSNAAIVHDQLECLRYVYKNGCPLPNQAHKLAISHHSNKCLRWFFC